MCREKSGTFQVQWDKIVREIALFFILNVSLNFSTRLALSHDIGGIFQNSFVFGKLN